MPPLSLVASIKILPALFALPVVTALSMVKRIAMTVSRARIAPQAPLHALDVMLALKVKTTLTPWLALLRTQPALIALKVLGQTAVIKTASSVLLDTKEPITLTLLIVLTRMTPARSAALLSLRLALPLAQIASKDITVLSVVQELRLALPAAMVRKARITFCQLIEPPKPRPAPIALRAVGQSEAMRNAPYA